MPANPRIMSQSTPDMPHAVPRQASSNNSASAGQAARAAAISGTGVSSRSSAARRALGLRVLDFRRRLLHACQSGRLPQLQRFSPPRPRPAAVLEMAAAGLSPLFFLRRHAAGPPRRHHGPGKNRMRARGRILVQGISGPRQRRHPARRARRQLGNRRPSAWPARQDRSNVVVLEKDEARMRQLFDQALAAKTVPSASPPTAIRCAAFPSLRRCGAVKLSPCWATVRLAARICPRRFSAAPAHFPVGPYLLAAVSGAPVFQTFVVRERIGHYRFFSFPAKFIRTGCFACRPGGFAVARRRIRQASRRSRQKISVPVVQHLSVLGRRFRKCSGGGV